MNTPTGTKRMRGFKHIIDDGVATDHGFFLPKQPTGKIPAPAKPAVFAGHVPSSKLRAVLARSGKRNADRLKAMRMRN